MTESAFTVRKANWERDLPLLRRVRETVFVKEQAVPLDLEWDEADPGSLHLLALDAAGNPVGTGRLTPEGQIGRMAVLKTWRGRGVGDALLRGLMDAARRRGQRELLLNAQVAAIGFYRRHGYTEEGDEFMDAGIPHRRMRLSLPGSHD